MFVQCKCGSVLEIAEKLRGREVKCPICSRVLRTRARARQSTLVGPPGGRRARGAVSRREPRPPPPPPDAFDSAQPAAASGDRGGGGMKA